MDHTLAPSYAGTVVLELGDGALIVYTGPGRHGQEIEISPINEPARRTHAAVRERRLGRRSAYCAVYPGLRAGAYTVWRDATAPAATITVTGGAVSELRLPSG